MANGPDYWDGQTRINGALCRVDWRLLEALREVKAALAACAGCAEADLTALTNAINAAAEISATVADIKPPGCNPGDPRG
jgi:hypothetical protein